MTKEEFLHNVEQVMVATQIGALLQEIIASADSIQGENWEDAPLGDLLNEMRIQCLHIVTATKMVAELVADNVFDSADVNTSYEIAEKVEQNILKRLTYLTEK